VVNVPSSFATVQTKILKKWVRRLGVSPHFNASAHNVLN
jgi:hypothetical protein